MHRLQQTGTLDLAELERKLLNDFQHHLPLTPRPYEYMATSIGSSEDQVIATLKNLQQSGAVSRVGAVFRTHRVGASTLAAMAVPEERLTEVADLVSSYEAVNHNYEREHEINLWFVATAADELQLSQVLHDIEQNSGIPVMALPMLEDFHIDLGFALQWT
ncbi:MAG: Lrp/AsnC family transcriptional regulator [Thiohalomonadaceae bacterium]|jgi:DNA-binding Lrp family transcriptional regulator